MRRQASVGLFVGPKQWALQTDQAPRAPERRLRTGLLPVVTVVPLSRVPAAQDGFMVTNIEELQRMIDALRRRREGCEPKSNTNPRYLHYSNAVSNLLWLIDDLASEEQAANQTW